MEHRKKVHRGLEGGHEGLRRRVESVLGAGRSAQAMKDWHLVVAALGADAIIASLDETARSAFADAAAHVSELRRVTWVNPSKSGEAVGDWLERGAPPEGRRGLGAR
jgi:hypothetical protein